MTIDNRELAPRLGTCDVLVSGGALIVIQTVDRAAAEAVLTALPDP